MKFTLTFKTPDVTDQADHLWEDIQNEDERYEVKRKIEEIIEKFIEFNEYIHIEFDTETMTAEVLKN